VSRPDGRLNHVSPAGTLRSDHSTHTNDLTEQPWDWGDKRSDRPRCHERDDDAAPALPIP
jgi:hypothetical protein